MIIILTTITIPLTIILKLNGLITSITTGIITYYLITEKPKNKAREERIKALSHAPEIITVLSTSLELNPNLENAVKQVGENCEGRISKEFSKAYRNSIIKGTPLNKSFNKIIQEWGEYSKGFKRGMNLIKTSLLEQNPTNTISTGVKVFFDGLTNELKKFLAKTKTHTLILFSFGTIMPLIIISMMPVISLLNINSSPTTIIIMLLINLIGLEYYANYIINNRPPTFSQLTIETKNKHITYSIILFIIISSPTLLYYGARVIGGEFPLPEYYASMPLIIGMTTGLSTYYYKNSKPFIKKRDKALKAEKELLNITYAIGTKLQEKRSFENTIKQIIKENKGEIIKHLRKAYQNIKELQTPIRKAIMNELNKTNSKRVKSVFSLIFQALKQGVDKSAKSVFKIYEHFNNMIQAEEEHKAMLEQVLSMMKITALAFAPLISGFIIIMQEMISNNITDSTIIHINNISINQMIAILGAYTIGLVIILTKYNIKIRNGPDKVTINYEIAKNIITATIIYLATIIIAKSF